MITYIKDPSPLLTLTQSQAQMQQMAASMGGAPAKKHADT